MEESIALSPPVNEGASCNKIDKNLIDIGNDDSASGRSSPEVNCAICLGRLENKSFTDSCMHQFCFNCLETWSRVKAECPLCKQTFKSIIHSVKSIEDFQEHSVEDPSDSVLINSINYQPNFEPREPAFRYRTTAVTSYLDYFLRLEDAFSHHVLPSMPAPTLVSSSTHWNRRRHLGTSDFRRSIYQQGLWVQGIRDVPRQYRESSPEFYRLNPAMVHRLVPWLNRELNVLCGNNQTVVQTVMSRILELLNQVPIRSPEFKAGVSQYLGRHTDHFVHEFATFACCALDMIGYDRHASYVTQSHLLLLGPLVPIDNDDDGDSDVQVVGPDTSPTISIHIESDSDECVIVDSVPAPQPPRARSPEVITLDSDDDVVQVNIHIPGPSSRTRRPPLKRNWLSVKSVKSLNENYNVSINIGHASQSRSRSTSTSSDSSNENWSPRRESRKKATKSNYQTKSTKKKEKKAKREREEDNLSFLKKEKNDRRGSKDGKSSKGGVNKSKLQRVKSSCPKKSVVQSQEVKQERKENDSDTSPLISPRRRRPSTIVQSSSSDDDNDIQTLSPEQYSSSDESEYKPRVRSVVIKTESQPSTSQDRRYSSSSCKTDNFEQDDIDSYNTKQSPVYGTSSNSSSTSSSSHLNKPSYSRRRSHSTSSSDCQTSKKNKHSEKRLKRNIDW